MNEEPAVRPEIKAGWMEFEACLWKAKGRHGGYRWNIYHNSGTIRSADGWEKTLGQAQAMCQFLLRHWTDDTAATFQWSCIQCGHDIREEGVEP